MTEGRSSFMFSQRRECCLLYSGILEEATLPAAYGPRSSLERLPSFEWVGFANEAADY